MPIYQNLEHVGRSLPGLVQRKILLTQQANVQSGVMFDLENALRFVVLFLYYLIFSTVENMKTSTPALDNCMEMLRLCIKLDIGSGGRKSSENIFKGRSKSLHDVSRKPNIS